MTSFHFSTADNKNRRRAWHCFIDEKFGLSSVSIGGEATFAGDIGCSSLGFLKTYHGLRPSAVRRAAGVDKPF
jgi:hypothetical protein